MRSPSPPPATRSVPRLFLARVIASAGLASLVLLLLVVLEWEPLMALERDVLVPLHDLAVSDPGLTRTNRILSDWVWDPWTMRALCAVMVAWLLWQGARLLAVCVAATSLAGTLLQQVLKWAVGRERPAWRDPVDSAHFNAYPSGHAMTATVACALLVWLLYRYRARSSLWRGGLVLAAVSVLGAGVTRLYLGVHWPTDVLAGWLFGVLLVAVTALAWGRWSLAASRPGPEAG
ncbi:phosphatase PAP2 family protein [Streptomyces sp. NPDC060194]|uniref:phosphatase PAP2 family protein n=1 Tax=Streptomyces sp. NPDC060194 TaxID=3347069 RepID=UPI00364AE63A